MLASALNTKFGPASGLALGVGFAFEFGSLEVPLHAATKEAPKMTIVLKSRSLFDAILMRYLHSDSAPSIPQGVSSSKIHVREAPSRSPCLNDFWGVCGARNRREAWRRAVTAKNATCTIPKCRAVCGRLQLGLVAAGLRASISNTVRLPPSKMRGRETQAGHSDESLAIESRPFTRTTTGASRARTFYWRFAH